jgi:hypothetical protein
VHRYSVAALAKIGAEQGLTVRVVDSAGAALLVIADVLVHEGVAKRPCRIVLAQ